MIYKFRNLKRQGEFDTSKLSEFLTKPAGLQIRACDFHHTRLLNESALVMCTSPLSHLQPFLHRGSVCVEPGDFCIRLCLP